MIDGINAWTHFAFPPKIPLLPRQWFHDLDLSYRKFNYL
jgi:hypothetical protein